jgi:adenylate cyclase
MGAVINLKKVNQLNVDDRLVISIKKQKHISVLPKKTLVFFHHPQFLNYFKDTTFLPIKMFMETSLKKDTKVRK